MHRFVHFVSLVIGLAWSTVAFSQISYKYTTFSYPGSTSTTATGINNGGVIVGSYVDSAGHSHGYRYANGTFTRIDHAGAENTYLNGINDYGDIVGNYLTSSGGAGGFKLHGGTFYAVNYPGQPYAIPMGINKYGEIVGYFGNAHGFIYSGGSYRQYDAPDNSVPDTILNGVSNLGAIVGQVFSYDDWRAFLLVGSDVDFGAPRAALDVQAYGVNGRGDVVGCHDGGGAYLVLNPESGETESTEKSSWKMQMLSMNGQTNFCAMSINYNRAIVGSVSIGGSNTKGFLAVPQ